MRGELSNIDPKEKTIFGILNKWILIRKCYT